MWTQRVKEWLKERERSQAWLARKAVMSHYRLNHYFSGRHKAGVRVLQRLERSMELEPGALTARR